MSNTDAFYPTGFDPDDGNSVDPDAGAATRRWPAADPGSLYRFVARRPSGSETIGAGSEAPGSTKGTDGTAPNLTVGSPDAAGAGPPLAETEVRGGGGSGSNTSSGTLAASSVEIGGAGGLVFDISFDSSVANAPSGFVSAIEYVAQTLAGTFSNPLTINIDVGWGEIGGQSLSSGALGQSETYLDKFSYGQVRSALAATATSADQKAAVAALPGTDPTGSNSDTLATAEAKALGLAGASSSLDGYVGFGSGSAYSFDPNNRAVSGAYDFIGVAAHEITEVMGRDSFLGEGLGYTPLDLFRYSGPGTRQLTPGAAAYFSTDGGNTNLDNFNTVAGGDYGDWASSAGSDAYDAFSYSGVANIVSATDTRVMNVLGYTLAASSSPPNSAPSGPAASAVTLSDTTTGQTTTTAGNPYSGPVSGLLYQYAYAGSDSVNITVASNNWFVKGGPGNDAIQAYGGYNVIDGGSGSNFLTGGSGTDTFFVDDRNAAADIWSTVNNFRQGDDATLFGITSAGTIQWFDNQGAASFTGLTVHASAPGQPTASLTLPGYSSSDLGDGRLAVQFGSESDGTPYMHIIASG